MGNEMIKNILCISIIIFSKCISICITLEAMGPYKAVLTELKACDNITTPKSYYEKTFTGNNTVITNLTIVEEVGPVQGKSRIYRLMNGKYAQAFVLNQKDVCNFTNTLKLFNQPLKADNNCVLQKGSNVNQINVNEFIHKSLQIGLFYGKYKVKLEWNAKDIYVLCLDAYIDILKL